MDLQHVNAKLFVKDAAAIDLEPLIPIFHNWIQDRVFEERLLDIADYRHVHDGPGVILIGLEGDYSVDNTDGRLGIRYNRKAVLAGNNHDRFKQAIRAALNACQRLENEPGLNGQLRFNGLDVELFINDRALAPNNEATRAAAEPDFKAFATELFRGGDCSLALSPVAESRRLLAVSMKASRHFSAAELLKNLP